MAATQGAADQQRAEERLLRELSESVQALRRQTEVLGAWRANLRSHVAVWGLILTLLTGTGIALAWWSREVALRTQGVLEQILENQAQLQAAKAAAHRRPGGGAGCGLGAPDRSVHGAVV